MRDADLVELHAKTLYTVDEAGNLSAVNERGGAQAPSVFVVWTRTDCHVFWRHTVEPAEKRAFEAEFEGHPRMQLETVSEWAREVESRHLLSSVWVGPAFVFSKDLPFPRHPGVVRVTDVRELDPGFQVSAGELVDVQPAFGTLVGGRVVSMCYSARTGAAAEAGVFTVEGHRGRGHAAAACRAWANEIASRGLVPLYSTSYDNVASRRLAERLSLYRFGVDFRADFGASEL